MTTRRACSDWRPEPARLTWMDVADTLKTFFSPSPVRRLASDLASVHPDFPVAPFVENACAGLDALELLDRGRHIARVLAASLPVSYPDVIDVLLRSLGPEHETDERPDGPDVDRRRLNGHAPSAEPPIDTSWRRA
jgi:hypothetical protein